MFPYDKSFKEKNTKFFFSISNHAGKRFFSDTVIPTKPKNDDETSLSFSFEHSKIIVESSILFELYETVTELKNKKKIFQFWFHTSFEDDIFMLQKNDLDVIVKSKKHNENFKIELKMESVSVSEHSKSDIIGQVIHSYFDVNKKRSLFVSPMLHTPFCVRQYTLYNFIIIKKKLNYVATKLLDKIVTKNDKMEWIFEKLKDMVNNFFLFLFLFYLLYFLFLLLIFFFFYFLFYYFFIFIFNF